MQVDGHLPSILRGVAPRTPSGKVELLSDALQQRYAMGLPQYRPLNDAAHPLTLISPASDKRINATFGGAPASSGKERLEMHPDDAAQRGLQAGDSVRVYNAAGAVELFLHVSRDIRPGVVSAAKGSWLGAGGQTVNALIPHHKTDIADGACYNDARVEVECVEPAAEAASRLHPGSESLDA